MESVKMFEVSFSLLSAFADPCDPNPCGSGTCTVQGELAVCQCPNGFTGEDCSTRELPN